MRAATQTVPRAAEARVGDYPLLVERKPPGLVGRYLTTQKHVLGLIFGGIRAWVTTRKAPHPRFYGLARAVSALASPFLDRELRDLSFPVQLRRRLEILGPTYIKLGQVLSLREDLFPTVITDELKNLLDRLPAAPLDRVREIVEHDLKRPVVALFEHIDPNPLGSASIAQVHRARTLHGDDVVIKVVKPGNRELLKRDTILLNLLGRFLQLVSRALPAPAGAARVHGVHPARARPAARGRQRRDLRGQLPRHARRRLPHASTASSRGATC
jgi:exoribonuclease R